MSPPRPRRLLPCLLLLLILTFTASTTTLLSHIPTTTRFSNPESLRGLLRSPPQSAATSKVVEEEEELSTEEYLRYWKRAPDAFSGLPATMDGSVFVDPVADEDRRYITFEDDTGGFNNIRMAFEVFVVMAKITGRILVLPPPCRFYLLDQGPIALFKRKGKSFSTYSHYYDLDYLTKEGGIKIISTKEFLKREAKNLAIPEKLVREANVTFVDRPNGDHTDYFLWLRRSPDGIIFPSGPTATAGSDFGLDSIEVLKSRGPGTIRSDKIFIHFPMQVGLNLRYLDGIPKLLNYTDPALVAPILLFIRNYLHFIEDPIFLAATKVINQLGGPGAYSALHIRRNELQFKEVFVSATESLNNVKSLLLPGEKLYLATDETSPGFFRAFREAGHQVFLLGDLLPGAPSLKSDIALNESSIFQPNLVQFGAPNTSGNRDDGINLLLVKYLGMVEQLVAACGRVFIGTSLSSFTSYTQRFRGYLGRRKNLKDLSCYFHNVFIAAGNPLDHPPPRCQRTKGDNGDDADMWRLYL